MQDNKLVQFYTGFQSYESLTAFYEFLGPSVSTLKYWGSKPVKTKQQAKKMDSLNQLFLTLIKLKLNLKERDLAYRFGIAVSVVFKYFITWVCFLHHHLREIEWMPDVDQVQGTLPYMCKNILVPALS